MRRSPFGIIPKPSPSPATRVKFVDRQPLLYTKLQTITSMEKIIFSAIIAIGLSFIIIQVAGKLLYKNQTQSNTSTSTPKSEISQSVPTQTATQTKEIIVTKSGFEPKTIVIKAGTKVVWTNQSGGPVTVNSAVHPTHLLYPPLNLGQFNDGSTASLVFDKSGKYTYHNHLNPGQTGTIIVE